MNYSNRSKPCSLKWNSSSRVAIFSILFSHMQIQCLFWSCHCPFLWEDGKIAGTPHRRKITPFMLWQTCSFISGMTISDKLFHSMWSRYLGTVAQPLLYFYSHSYCFSPLHSCTDSLLKLCTTISAYKKVSITTVILSLPSCKLLLSLLLERKQYFFQVSHKLNTLDYLKS